MQNKRLLNISAAYFQKDVRESLSIDTHIGQILFQPTRVQFRDHSEKDTFQKETEKRLRRIPFVIVQIDDTLITEWNDKEQINKF